MSSRFHSDFAVEIAVCNDQQKETSRKSHEEKLPIVGCSRTGVSPLLGGHVSPSGLHEHAMAEPRS